MSEEYSRKRQRDEYEDGDYEPFDNQNDATALPPHMMEDANIGNNDDYVPPHQREEMDDISVVEENNHNNNAGTSRVDNYQDVQQRANEESFNAGGNGNRKRQRRMQLSNEITRVNELCNSLFTLGDANSSVKTLLTQSSETMSYFWSDEDFSSSFIKFIGSVIVEMPHKSILYSGLVILANAKNDQIGKDIVQWLKERINVVFDDMKREGMSDDNQDESQQMYMGKTWNRVVLIIRFLALLNSVIDDYDDVVVKLMRQLIELAIELQNSNSERCGLAEMIYYDTILSLPYLLVNDKDNENLKSKVFEIIQTSKQFDIKFVSAEEEKIFKPFGKNDDRSCVSFQDILKDAPGAIEQYLNDDNTLFYDVCSIISPLIKFVLNEKSMTKTKEEGEEDVEFVMIKHKLGEIDLPNSEILNKFKNLNDFSSIRDKLWRTPRYHINVFKFENSRKELDFATLPDIFSFESMILNDIISNMLINVEFNRVTVSKQLLNLPIYFNEKRFCRVNSPLDKLMIINDLNKGLDFDLIKNLEDSTEFEEKIKFQMINSAKKIQSEFEDGFKSTWKMEEVVIENIINFIFAVPKCEEIPLIYFETLIADTCGRDWTLVKKNQLHSNESLIFSKLIGDCFRYFYENIEKFEIENINRFINWFLLQISNFKFEWEWQEWVSDIVQLGDESIYNPKIYFIKNVIHKEILITNFKFIRDKTLPLDFKKFANLSLKNKEELIEYDSKFFGNEFASKNTNDPFEINEEEDAMDENNNELIIETNTDTYKLFSHYLFNHDEHPYNDLCRDIYMNLENTEESEESLIELVEKLREKIDEDGGNIVKNSGEYIITLVTESICLIGSRSFSVFEESLNKVFGDKLKTVINNIKEWASNNGHSNGGDVDMDVDMDKMIKEWIINGVLRIWNSEPRIGLLFIEMLCKFGVLDELTVIRSVWNCFNCDDAENIKIWPLSEVYCDEYLDRLIDVQDEEEEEAGEEGIKQKEMAMVYFEECVRKINDVVLKGKEAIINEAGEIEELDDKSGETKWCVYNLLWSMISKVRKFGKGDSALHSEVRALIQNDINETGIREYLLRLVR